MKGHSLVSGVTAMGTWASYLIPLCLIFLVRKMGTNATYFVDYIFLGGGLLRRACGILVPRPGVEPRPTAVKATSPNYWTAREFPIAS